MPKDTFIKNLRSFPSYKEVTEYFFNRYEPISSARKVEFEVFGQSGLSIDIRFAKEPNGWYVYETKASEPGAGFIYNKQQIWNLKELAYLDVNYLPLKNEENARKNLKQHVSESDYRLYSVHPFYGYEGWEKDIISNMRSYHNLPDSLLFGLARAYTSSSVNSIRHMYKQAEVNNKPSDHEEISQKRLNMFLHNIDSAFIHYRELIKQNPKFQTLVGPITRKYNHELMFAWHNLMSIKKPGLAEKYLRQVNYDSLTLSIANNILISVSDSGILFVNGDSETFTLWYLQEFKQLRQDVSILNLNLLKTSSYVEMAGELLNRDGKPNLISFEQSYIKDYKMESGVYVIRRPIERYVELSDVISFLKEGKIFEFYLFITANKFKLKVPNKIELVRNNIIKPDDSLFVDNLNFFPRRNFFSLADIIVFDILSNNNWHFPIHFATTIATSSYLGLDKYLNLYGLTYKLQPISNDKDHIMKSGYQINASESYKLIMDKFLYMDFHSSDSMDRFASIMAYNIRYFTGELANTMIIDKKPELALNMLAKIAKEIPSEKYPHNYFSLLHAEAYLRIGERGKALPILDYLAEEQIKKIKELTYALAKSNGVPSERQDLKMHQYTLYKLVEACKTYDLQDRYSRYNDFLQSSMQQVE